MNKAKKSHHEYAARVEQMMAARKSNTASITMTATFDGKSAGIDMAGHQLEDRHIAVLALYLITRLAKKRPEVASLQEMKEHAERLIGNCKI